MASSAVVAQTDYQSAEKSFAIDCHLQYAVAQPSHFIFQIEAIQLGQQVTREVFTLNPNLQFERYTQPFTGNQLTRVNAPQGTLDVHYSATVALSYPALILADLTEAPVWCIPAQFVHLLSPSRYCESDLLGAAARKMFGDCAPGWERVEAIRRWIHANIEYLAGSSTPLTTACDAFVRRAGVCRDFAHLGIAFCRALSIPARFVVGYVKFPNDLPDFHAVFEAWLGDRWVLFDATEMAPVENLIRVGTGVDAKDVPFATLYGSAVMLSMCPAVEEVRLEVPNNTSFGMMSPNTASALA